MNTIQQVEMSQKFHRLPFHLCGTHPCLIDSLSDSSYELLWHPRLIHCGEHTLMYIHNHVDGVSNLSKLKFNDLTHCETCLQATLINSPAGHHSLRVRRLSRLAQNNANKRHLQIYSRGTNLYKKFGTNILKRDKRKIGKKLIER